MSLEESTRESIAEDLYAALRSGHPIAPPTDRHDLDVADAYAVQSAFVDRRIDEEGPVVGHKIGLTSAAIRRQLGVDEPDFGRLLSAMFVPDRTVPTGDLIAPRIEPEIGFVLDGPIEPPATALEVLGATRAVVPVLEVIDSRVRDWEITLADTVADNASSALYCVGDRTVDPSGLDLSLEGVKLYHDGDLVDSGVGAAVLDHPAAAVAWLANTLDDLGEGLGPGDVVLSGSVTPAVDLAPGDVVTAEFASLGSLTVRAE